MRLSILLRCALGGRARSLVEACSCAAPYRPSPASAIGPGMKRRTLLRASLAASALAAAGFAGMLRAFKAERQSVPQVGGGTLPSITSSKHVAIVGGGLAGMAAAATLAQRGYRVTLVEKANHLGGKLAGWPIQVQGETVPMEHGFHGFFSQYYNLRAFLAEAGADQHMVPQDAYTVLFADGREEAFGGGSLPFPMDLLQVVNESPSLDLEDVAGDRPGMRALLSYDPVRTFEEWDHIDAETFVKEGRLEGAFAELILRPFGQASMNGLRQLSAAELIRFFHFYMLGNPEGLAFDALGLGCHLSILEPLSAYLEELGVAVRLGAQAHSVRFENGRAVGVVLGGPSQEHRIERSQIPQQGWVALGPAFVRQGPDGLEARSSRCTHMGCPVQLSQGGFACPCHNGRYDAEGRNISGPPPRPLEPLKVEVIGAQAVLRLLGAEETLDADAVILATEVGPLQAIAHASELETAAPSLNAAIQAVGMAEPYAVCRFWFDAPVLEERTAFYTVAGYRWTDSLAIYSKFQAPYIEWAERTGGSVVESHAYAIPPQDLGSVDSHREALLSELRLAFPELADAKVLHSEAMTQDNFTSFGVGTWAKRSTVDTEIPNLFLAGDHVKLDFPAFLMEAAVSSGRLAAAHICAQDGVVEPQLFAVESRGRLAGLVVGSAGAGDRP